MLLSEILKRDSNNLDLLRLFAACMVIYGHAYSIVPEEGKQDFVQSLLGYEYSGSLAVKFFFFISGLVVSNSLFLKKNPLTFAVSRVFRIWPAFMLVVVISAFVVGPIYTTFSFAEYFGSEQFSVGDYVFSNLIMDIRYYLPGVFFELPYEAAVNGSLWTLYYEIGAYLGILLMYLLGFFRGKIIGTVALLLVMVGQEFLDVNSLPSIFHQPVLVQCFALGALLALHKDKIYIHSGTLILLWLCFFFFKEWAYSKYLLYIALFVSLLYLSGIKSFLSYRPRYDVSYGVYLWGFPVQQVMAYHFLELGVHFNQVASVVVCIVLGCLSWLLVESRFIKYGILLSGYLEKKIHIGYNYLVKLARYFGMRWGKLN